LALRSARASPAESKPILDDVDKMLGFVPNLQRLMSISPNALSGWATPMGTLAKTLDVKTKDEIALAVSEADGCDYCRAAHSFTVGKLAKIPADEIELNRRPDRAIPSVRLPSLRRSGWGMDRHQHRRDDRADCPVPVNQLYEQ
jgi:hypothetical protein